MAGESGRGRVPGQRLRTSAVASQCVVITVDRETGEYAVAGFQNGAFDKCRVRQQDGDRIVLGGLALSGVEIAPGLAAFVDQGIVAQHVPPTGELRLCHAVFAKVHPLIVDACFVKPLARSAASVAGLDAVERDHHSALRSSSLMLTLARVDSSTFLTMM